MQEYVVFEPGRLRLGAVLLRLLQYAQKPKQVRELLLAGEALLEEVEDRALELHADLRRGYGRGVLLHLSSG